MAMVLDAFASYLQDTLKEMAADQIHLLLGVSVEIDKMTDKLEDLKNFLADADRRNITDKSVRVWVTELKHAMYDATDILDDCQLKAMERGEPTDKGFCNSFLTFIRSPFDVHDMGTRIKALNERLNAIKQRGDAFSFINLGSYEGRGQSMRTSRPGNPSPETSGELDRSGVVGGKIEEDTRELVAKILQTGDDVKNNIMVVAIVGVGGIGKTTLAQNVFNNESIQSEFEKKIWLSINQSFDKVKLLRTAITLAGGNPAGQEALAVLQPILITALEGKKVLLVMDDLWSHRAWESVLKTPLVKAAASGSRVLITTRDEAVARGMSATWPHHHIDTLSPKDAWSLLKKQVLSNEKDEDHINTLKDIGLKIIEKCGGLPLAVKVMGGLLRQTEMLRRDWEQVVDDSKWSTTEMPQELNHAVYLSYEAMPPYLKQCFLYYSILPKIKTFNRTDVIAMWISEGFIHGNSSDLEETGKKYYKELISRNLIEPDKDVLDQWYCSMHDVVRSFAQYMTRDEALIAHNGEIDILTKLNSQQKFLRLSMETTILQSGELEWKSLQEQKSVRTLISIGKIKMNPGDSLLNFSSLRTLYIESEGVSALVESLHQLKHLRYLALLNAEISVLPENIGKMKLLQFIDLSGCAKLVNLPDSIVKLGQLRHLDLPDKVSMIPRDFRCLTNMRSLYGFPVHVDGDWCSLDELGPLSQLRFLSLVQLENISASSSAANACLGEKMHIIDLYLSCTSKLGYDGLVKQENGVSKDEQTRIEKVFDELCPPTSVQYLNISGYFGQQLPSWMMSKSMVSLNNLKSLLFSDLACCTQLPNGLCQLSCLQFLQVNRAPCIRSVGTEFLHPSQVAAAPFPRLKEMRLFRMVEWEEWEWEEKVQAMPRLAELFLNTCKLRRLPPGLASNARALRKLSIKHVKQLRCLESFPFVVELTVDDCPDLESITNLPKVQKLTITGCPKLKVLKDVPELRRLVMENVEDLSYLENFPFVVELTVIDCPDLGSITNLPKLQKLTITRCLKLKSVKDVPALQRLVLEDGDMETLPGYLGDVNPSYLELRCSLTLLTPMAAGESGQEFAKFSHIEHVKAYGKGRELFVLYTRKPYNFHTNIKLSFEPAETLSSSMVDTRGFEHLYKMKRSTFDYVCSLVRVPFLEDMMLRDHRFDDETVLSLQDRVAVALRMLNSGESSETVGSSMGVNESIVSLVTKSFVDAMYEKAIHHLAWPSSSGIENIKYKFDKIHGLPNCCGVVHTDHITFGSQNCDHEVNGRMLMQAVVDTDMRFTNIWFGSSGSMNQSSILQFSDLFKECEKGTWLNGSKLNFSDGRQVGEYIIGDAGFPLLPWLLTSYQKDDLSDCQVEFNRRHSEAMTVTLTKAMAMWKDTWKFLHGAAWRPENQFDRVRVISVCCMLHNIVIDKESDAGMGSHQKVNYYGQQVRQLADEDPVMARDILSQLCIFSGGTLPIFEDTQRLESVLKMPRRAFDYVCSLAKEGSLEDMDEYTFLDGRLMRLQDRVAIALIVLNSAYPPATIGSSVGVNESTLLQVTKSFVHAMAGGPRWPSTTAMEKIKYKFEKTHGLPNCCGVVHTTRIPFVSQNSDHEKNEDVLMQVIVDSDMRFRDVEFEWSDCTNQLSTLQNSVLFMACEDGDKLNGSKLKVLSDGSEEVGEYIIGDAGYPLRPWLLTPYQLENGLSDSEVEFNKRHSEAMAIALKALARLKDTWKWLHGGTWRPDNPDELEDAVQVCCRLHNIVIDMEKEGAGMPSDEEESDSDQEKRQLKDEDAVRARDLLSEYMISRSSESRVDLVDQEEQQEVASSGLA